MNIKPWTVPENIDKVIKFKPTDEYLVLQYYNHEEQKLQLLLDYTTITEMLETELETGYKPDQCRACGHKTKNYISIQNEDENDIPIHEECYSHFKTAINYIKENHKPELLAHSV